MLTLVHGETRVGKTLIAKALAAKCKEGCIDTLVIEMDDNRVTPKLLNDALHLSTIGWGVIFVTCHPDIVKKRLKEVPPNGVAIHQEIHVRGINMNPEKSEVELEDYKWVDVNYGHKIEHCLVHKSTGEVVAAISLVNPGLPNSSHVYAVTQIPEQLTKRFINVEHAQKWVIAEVLAIEYVRETPRTDPWAAATKHTSAME